MAEKFNINEKVAIKAKNLPKIEYEAVMDAYRASMLFFEKELRKLRDRKTISTETLKSIAKHIDLSELIHLKFSTLEPMKLVKMSDVQRVVQEFNQSTHSPQIPQGPIRQNPPPTTIAFTSAPQQPQYDQQQDIQPPTIGQTSPLPQPISEKTILPTQPLSAKDTATAVMELRKLMIENLKKFKRQYSE